MPSILNLQVKAPDYRFYPLWLERLFGHLMNAAYSIYRLVLFLSNWTVTVVTLGAPYIYYKLYRHNGNESQSSAKYSQMVKELDTLWDQYSNFLLPILPVLFPMVTLSGVPMCSIASFAATMTFVAGVTSVGTRIILKVKAKALHNEHAVNEWRQASERPWCKVPKKSFWILFSLPTFFFLLSVGLLISTVLLTFWERPVATGVIPKSETQGCTVKRLQAFKNTLLAVLVAVVAHLNFVIIKLHFLTAFQNVESTSAA